jgi:tetratricopeptide (TPR) repeat protein
MMPPQQTMPNLIEAITQYPDINAFRRLEQDADVDDPRECQYVPVPGDVVADADQSEFYILGAMNILSKTDIRRCYMDVSTPERINDYAYLFDGRELHYDYSHKLGGECIPAIALDGFGVYELFHSKISPELGIEVLRRGLRACRRKRFIAHDLGYILRDEGRYREAAEMFQLAADEEVPSYFTYGELASLYGKLGDSEKHARYEALFERARRGGA